MTDNGWIGIDLDGVLAKYSGWKGPQDIGEPIMPMVMFVKQLLRGGSTVKIFTSRAGYGKQAIDAIRAWLVRNGLPPLEVTDRKDQHMIRYYDDRAVQVQTNTGRIMSPT